MYETTTTMMGRLVDRPQRWDFDGGGLKATFRLAHTARRFDKVRGEWGDGQSLYLTVNCWRVLAERVMAAFTKGDPVIVHGSLRTREWEKDGKRHSVTELDATAVGPDLTRCSAALLRHPPSEPRGEAKERAESADEDRGWSEDPPADDAWSTHEQAEVGVGV